MGEGTILTTHRNPVSPRSSHQGSVPGRRQPPNQRMPSGWTEGQKASTKLNLMGFPTSRKRRHHPGLSEVTVGCTTSAEDGGTHTPRRETSQGCVRVSNAGESLRMRLQWAQEVKYPGKEPREMGAPPRHSARAPCDRHAPRTGQGPGAGARRRHTCTRLSPLSFPAPQAHSGASRLRPRQLQELGICCFHIPFPLMTTCPITKSEI